MTTVPQPNEERNDIAALPWYRMVFESLTMYGELSAAHIPEEFAPVRLRFQREWSFNGGFASRFTMMFCFRFSLNSSLDVQLVALAAQVYFSTLCRLRVDKDI